MTLKTFAVSLGLPFVCGCQTVFGDFEVSAPPAEEPAEVLGAACEPGAYRCTNELLETCGDDRSGFVVADSCNSPAECNLNAGSCRPCVPGERMCRENVLERCDDALSFQVEATCETAALCHVAPDRTSGTCDPPVCPLAGAHRCDGAKLLHCSAGRDRLEPVELCETPELCDAAYADDLATAGARGECRPPACGPNAYRCEGATLEHCALDRTGWDQVTVCDSADQCSSGRGACGACAPGDLECNGAELRRCSASGGWETLDTCDAVALCDAEAGRCRDAECHEPGALRCGNEGVPALEKCSDDLAWEVVEVCATVELCSTSAGRCLAPACSGEETRCRGDRHERCSRDLTRWGLIATCAAGELCDAEQGCLQGVCTEGNVRCNGPSLERCIAGRYEEALRCATPVLCHAESASCTPPRCDAGPAYECDGSIIQKCRAGRDDFDEFRTCPAGTMCDATPSLGTGLPECDVCTANAYECDGSDLLRCSSDGQAKVRVASCPAGCSVTGGVPSCG